MLSLKNLCVCVDGKDIVKNLCLTLKTGSMHVCMGPNGSGKSTLAMALAGHPLYTITRGSITMADVDITLLSPHERAKKGLFLAMQQPPEVPGVTVNNLLKESFRIICSYEDIAIFDERVDQARDVLKIPESFLYRGIHEGFSGGEKKRCEMLQLMVLRPAIAILDEIDSGLDIDALSYVTEALDLVRKIVPNISLLLITHYQRIVQYIRPDYVHIMTDGMLVRSGNIDLIEQVERAGYQQFSSPSS